MLTGRQHTRPSRRGGGHYTVYPIFILSFIIVTTLPACSPKIIERIVVQHDTTTVHHRDTTYRRDSVYIREWMKGDTVYIDRFRDRYVYRDRWRDSVRIVERHDTTAVQVKVEKPLSWSQKARMGAFPWLLLVVLALGVWTFRKRIF